MYSLPPRGEVEEPGDHGSPPESTNQRPSGPVFFKAMGKRQKTDSSVYEGRDVETHDSTPEAVSEPEIKRRKPVRPNKVRQPSGRTSNTSLPVENSSADIETGSATTTTLADTQSVRRETPTVAGNGNAMIVHGFSHEFELEVDVEATLRIVIRLIQPSVNFDLSKATITLRGEHELTLDTRLRYFVRGGSQGLVKVKLVVMRKPGDVLRVTIMDVLQAEPIPPPIHILALVGADLSVPHEVSDPKKRSRKVVRKSRPVSASLGFSNVNNSDWVTSESFNLLRSSLGLPLDPMDWDQSHVSHWLAWATKSFFLPELNVTLFSQVNGKELCSMSRDLFTKLVGKDQDDLFWTHFHILRTSQRAAVLRSHSSPEPVSTGPSSKVPIKRLNKSTGAKKPLTMSDGWKNRDEEFFSSDNAGAIQLWQFLLETLAAGQHQSAIGWTGEPGEFVLLEPERVAELWGKRKNKDNMNYEKMSRALRYYYGGDVLAKVPGKHYTYKFVCDLSAAGYTGPGLASRASTSRPASVSGSRSSPHTDLSSEPSSPSVHGSMVGDSDGSLDVPARLRKAAKSQRMGSLANALESIRQRQERSVSQVAA